MFLSSGRRSSRRRSGRKGSLELLKLRNPAQDLPGNGSDLRTLVGVGDRIEHLADAGIGVNWLQHTNCIGADGWVVVVQNCFKNGVADAHVFGYVRLQTLKRLL